MKFTNFTYLPLKQQNKITLGFFAVVKMVIVFAGLFGFIGLGKTFATGEINSGNITQGSTGIYSYDNIAPQTILYQRAITGGGGEYMDEAKGIKVDNEGNSYVAGIFGGTATFGLLPSLTSSGVYDAFIAKISSTGLYLRIQQGGGMDDDIATSVEIDNQGNSYIAGYFKGTAIFGSITLVSNGNEDAFIAKLSSTGLWLRAVKGGGSNLDRANGIAVDSQGNSYIAGIFNNTANFGTTTLISSGYSDTFIAKLSSTGLYLRAVKGGGARGTDSTQGIAVDSQGNSYIAGLFEGTTSFGSITLITSGQYDAFVAKLSSTGLWLRAVKGGGVDLDQANGIAVDSGGNSYIAGYFEGTTNFGSITLISSGRYDIFTTKLSSTGLWLRAVKGGGAGRDKSFGIAVDNIGNSYIAGSFYGEVEFGTTTLIANGLQDIFTAKLSPKGEYLRAMQGGGPGFEGRGLTDNDQANGIAIDGDGNTYVVGIFGGIGIFGTTTLNSNPSTFDTFIARLSSYQLDLFTINNDVASTILTGVTLNISTTPAATHMRFSDDGASRSSRETYATSKVWTLPGTFGTKTIYAQFDANGDLSGDIQTSDNIKYSEGGSGGSNCIGGGPGEVCLSLEITATDGYCQYGKDLNLGQHDQTYSAFTMTGDFVNLSGNDIWLCDDTAGKAAWTLDIFASNLVTSNGAVYTISNNLIEMYVNTPQKYNGNNNYTFDNGDFNNIWSNLATVKTVFAKTSAAGTIGKIGTNNVDLRVLVPTNQEVGQYQSTITIQVPVMSI